MFGKQIFSAVTLVILCINSSEAAFVADAGGPYILESGNDLVLDGSGTDCGSSCLNITSFGWDIDRPSTSDIARILFSSSEDTFEIPPTVIPWTELCPAGSCIGSLGTIELVVLATVQDFGSTIPQWVTEIRRDFTTLEVVAPRAIPLPAAFWLFTTALVGLIGFTRRRKAA